MPGRFQWNAIKDEETELTERFSNLPKVTALVNRSAEI